MSASAISSTPIAGQLPRSMEPRDRAARCLQRAPNEVEARTAAAAASRPEGFQKSRDALQAQAGPRSSGARCSGCGLAHRHDVIAGVARAAPVRAFQVRISAAPSGRDAERALSPLGVGELRQQLRRHEQTHLDRRAAGRDLGLDPGELQVGRHDRLMFGSVREAASRTSMNSARLSSLGSLRFLGQAKRYRMCAERQRSQAMTDNLARGARFAFSARVWRSFRAGAR